MIRFKVIRRRTGEDIISIQGSGGGGERAFLAGWQALVLSLEG